MNRDDFFTLERHGNGVMTIWMDLKGEKINKVGPDMVGLFDGIFEEIEADDSIKALVLNSKKKDFIAGADIEAFKLVRK